MYDGLLEWVLRFSYLKNISEVSEKYCDLAIMVLSSCCGVGSLRTGTLIIGALNLVLALLVLPLAVWCASDPSVSAKICRNC